MTTEIDAAVADVLSSKRLKLVHPGDGKLTQVYATPGEVTSVLAEAVTHRGQYRVSSNNLALGAQSNFILSTSAILDNVVLSFNHKAPDGCYFSHSGWGFDLIESIEVTYANSLMQNMVIRGDILKEYSKLCVSGGPDEVRQMLSAAGPMGTQTGGGETLASVIPLSFLNFTTACMRGSWPMDASTLAGPIQVSINWVSETVSQRIFVESTLSIGPLSTSVSDLQITATTITLQRASFGVKDAMSRDRSLVYSIPSRYLSIVNENRVVNNITDLMSINLNSAPAGMLEGILIYAAPSGGLLPTHDNWTSGGLTKRKHGGSLRIDSMRLQFGSQDLLFYRTREEMLAFNRSTFGDSLTYFEQIVLPNQVSPQCTQAASDVLFLPLIQNGKGVLRGHVNEHVPSYGGSQLQLYLTFSNESMQTAPSSPFGPEDNSNPVSATQITIWICYIISSILEISQGTVDLQL